MDRHLMPTDTVDADKAEAIADRLVAAGMGEALSGTEIGVDADKVDAIAERMIASGFIAPASE